ncbi:hypothetical protein HZS_7843 [Henneguya salminicola]|nr:hypothetical protein HZS_7843 [Henneguya salminicola]
MKNTLQSLNHINFNLTLTISCVENVRFTPTDVIKYSINNIQKLFQSTYGIYHGTTEHFNFNYKIGFINYLYKNHSSSNECNITKNHKCDKNGEKICRDPTKINFPACNECNNIALYKYFM